MPTWRGAPSLLYLPSVAAALPVQEMAGASGNQAGGSQWSAGTVHSSGRCRPAGRTRSP